jgi:hypothetical protein
MWTAVGLLNNALNISDYTVKNELETIGRGGKFRDILPICPKGLRRT